MKCCTFLTSLPQDKRLLRNSCAFKEKTVSDYSISFCTLAAESGWNETALIPTFLNGLSETLKDCLAATKCPKDLESIISQAIRLDNRL